MREPSFQQLLILGLLLVGLLIFIQLGIFTLALEKLGLSSHSIFLVLMTSLFGSAINLPLFTIQGNPLIKLDRPPAHGLLLGRPLPYTGKTIIAINMGGALIPILVSIYLIRLHQISFPVFLSAIFIVSGICYTFSRPIPGLGIGMPVFIAPISAALTAILLAPEQSASLAYVCGTIGVLIGADLLRLNNIRDLGAPVAAIGGAGTFDGIFITGIVAVLLA
ncbi:MAG: DUF1614 domain-containing protein [Gammaproteobacteria bacterium]|nr:DUF1614 domain-containing protein [Gammaproteobacteria bacterium]MDH5650914.1 DUF1614 domain-containing protein [Gammaproteobacteria bacterium]